MQCLHFGPSLHYVLQLISMSMSLAEFCKMVAELDIKVSLRTCIKKFECM